MPLIIVVELGNTFKLIADATICVVTVLKPVDQIIPYGATFAFGTTDICAPILTFKSSPKDTPLIGILTDFNFVSNSVVPFAKVKGD